MSLTLQQLLALKLQQQSQQPQPSPSPQQGQNVPQNYGNQLAMLNMMQPNAQGQYSGITNGLSPIIGALALQNMQNQIPQSQLSQNIESGNGPTSNPNMFSQAGNWLSNLFGMGGNGQ